MLTPYYGSRGSTPISDSGLGGASPAIYQPPRPEPFTALGGLDGLVSQKVVDNQPADIFENIAAKISGKLDITRSGCTITVDYRSPIVGPQLPPIYFSFIDPRCRDEEPPPPEPEPPPIDVPLEPPDYPPFPKPKPGESLTYHAAIIGKRLSTGETYVIKKGVTYREALPFPESSLYHTSFNYERSLDYDFITESASNELTGGHETYVRFKIVYRDAPEIVDFQCMLWYKRTTYHEDSTTFYIDFNQVIITDDSGKPIYPPPPPPRRKPPPPPPPPPRKCCMGCCPSNSNNNNNDALLRLILAFVQRVDANLQKVDKKVGDAPFTVDIFDSDETKREAQKKTETVNSIAQGLKIAIREGQKELKILGIDTFPMKTKETTIFPEKSGIWGKIFKNIDPDKEVKITSITDFLIWQEEQRQAQMGRWMQVIEVDDADSTKEGEQYKKVVLPNVAETLKEIVMQNVLNARSQGLVLDIVLKVLSEVCSTKIVSSQGTTIVKDIQEYLDYTTVEKAFQVPVQISIPGKDSPPEEEEDLAKFLEPSYQPFVSAEWDGKMSFSDVLLDILQAVSIIRAAGFKQTK